MGNRNECCRESQVALDDIEAVVQSFDAHDDWSWDDAINAIRDVLDSTGRDCAPIEDSEDEPSGGPWLRPCGHTTPTAEGDCPTCTRFQNAEDAREDSEVAE